MLPVTSANNTRYEPEASVLLIGMRGSGKTYLGKIAAAELGWEYLDADEYLEKFNKTTCKEFVQERGWDAFRKEETKRLSDILDHHPHKTVISLGGGIVETELARNILKEYAERTGPVVHISRDIHQIIDYLTHETERPPYSEEIQDVFNRRKPWFDECCSHQFVSIVDPEDASHPSSVFARVTQKRWIRTKEEVRTYFRHITGVEPNLAPNLVAGRRSYFLSLTIPDLTAQPELLDESQSDILTGIDAVELRVDLLSLTGVATKPNIPSREYVTQQLAYLKHATPLPVVYTVRTVSQGGAFPDDAQDELFGLLHLGVQLGAEYIDVEITSPHEKIEALAAVKGFSRIIASHHDWSGNLKWSGPDIERYYATAARLGDIVKIVGKANDLKDNISLSDFVEKKGAAKPFIAVNLGTNGQLSRILNTTFSPVTHPQLPVAAAPGQLSFAQIQTGLHLLGQLPRKKFFLFGSPISKSPSPTLHNTGFSVLGLPHVYSLHETTTVDNSIRQIIRMTDFGGASVTIPHKIPIMEELDDLSPAARLIGAVNTITPTQQGDGTTRLIGDNTDWIGIRNSVLSKSRDNWSAKDSGLVIGAGGTARAAIYALHSLGLGTIYVFNRTKSTAVRLAGSFPQEYNILVLDSISEVEIAPPGIIVSTVPSAATTAGGELKLTSTMFCRVGGGVVVEMAYLPKVTPLVEMAIKVSEESPESRWDVVYGVEVLLEQGYEQFRLWTSHRAPRRAIRERVIQLYDTT